MPTSFGRNSAGQNHAETKKLKSSQRIFSGKPGRSRDSSQGVNKMKTRLVVAVFVAISLCSISMARDDRGQEVYNKIINKYVKFSTYSDHGFLSYISNNKRRTITFSTEYTEPNILRIEYVMSPYEGLINCTIATVVCFDGKKAYLSRNNVVQEFPSIQRAIGASTGTSMGITSTIPSLLLGGGVGAGIHRLQEPRRLDDQEIRGKKCYHLQANRYNGRVVDIWASIDDLLVRKVKTGNKEILYESIRVDAGAERDVLSTNATSNVRFVEVGGKSYSFSIPDNVKFEAHDEPERYAFFLPSETISPFMIIPNPGVKGTNSIPEIVTKTRAGFMEKMKMQDDKVISVAEKSCKYGLFVGGEIKFTLQLDTGISTDQCDQYLFQLWDGNRGWSAVFVSSNTNDIKLVRKILESGKRITEEEKEEPVPNTERERGATLRSKDLEPLTHIEISL